MQRSALTTLLSNPRCNSVSLALLACLLVRTPCTASWRFDADFVTLAQLHGVLGCTHVSAVFSALNSATLAPPSDMTWPDALIKRFRPRSPLPPPAIPLGSVLCERKTRKAQRTERAALREDASGERRLPRA